MDDEASSEIPYCVLRLGSNDKSGPARVKGGEDESTIDEEGTGYEEKW